VYSDVVRYNTTTPNEYFLCENRQQTGFDAGIPGHGMIIYHVDGDFITLHMDPNDINAGSHQELYPMSATSAMANGIMPSSSSTINTTGCPWSGTDNKTTFTDVTIPNSISWSVTNTNKPLINIEENIVNKEVFFCFLSCGTVVIPCPGIPTVTVNHLVSGGVDPVDKTVTYGTVTGIPGEPLKCWITSNLGADHQADSVNDASEPPAGWYWQFNCKQGYKHDGTNRTPNTIWITSINENLDWQPINDPCALELGSGWHLPASSEFTNIDAIGNWIDWNGPWNSGLKMHAAGYLDNSDCSLNYRGLDGDYWSNTEYDAFSGRNLGFGSGGSIVNYYYKASGFSVRCLRDAISPTSIPSVTTIVVSNIGTNTATSGGNVTDDGGVAVSVRGICWSTSSNPTTTDSNTIDGSGTGAFVINLVGLSPLTLYYVRAYATNSLGTAYGNEVTFTTQNPCPGIPIVNYGGQAYNTIQIGNQCWLRENLNIGTRINGSQNQTNNSFIEKYCYDDLESNCDIYGGLYQWDEVMQYIYTEGLQGICPSGWHLPDDVDWDILLQNVGTAGFAGGSLKQAGTIHWAAPNNRATNNSEFTALPGGTRTNTGTFNSLTLSTNIWSSSVWNPPDATSIFLQYSRATFNVYTNERNNGFSGRCLKNCSLPSSPSTGLHIPSTTQILWNWNSVTDALGYKWNTVNNYTTATNLGNVISKAEAGLNCGTAFTRYIWAYNACGHSPITILTQSTLPCPTTACGQPVTDNRDGKVYTTVQIGNQCWFRENLNIGFRIDGSQDQLNNGIIEKYCNEDLESNCDIYGGLYQWNELMQNFTNQGIQGICPMGSHLPAQDDFNVLFNYLGGDGYVGEKLKEAGTLHWNPPNTGATNSSGFTALPGGSRSYGFFSGINTGNMLWTSTYVPMSSGYFWYLLYNGPGFGNNDNVGTNAMSVRCILDCAIPTPTQSGSHTSSPNQIIWNWNSVAGATGYKWNTTNDYSTAMDMGSATTFTETGLLCNTAYTRYVWVYNSCGYSFVTQLDQSTLPITTSISISVSANPVCSGLSITLIATPTNGGTAPSFQWKVNGVASGANSNTFIYTPMNNDQVQCILYSTIACASGIPALSNVIYMTVLPVPYIDFNICNNITSRDAQPFILNGGIPAGGTYSGNGVVGSIFNPSMVPPLDYFKSKLVVDSSAQEKEIDQLVSKFRFVKSQSLIVSLQFIRKS